MGLYPPVEPYDSGLLPVGGGQEIYWEECGNPDGKPAVVLHGGPGGGLLPDFRRWFDPAAYRIVLFDQRGCGQSRPHAADPGVSLAANTTAHLVADTERLREHLGIGRWLVFGGSWGSTLALAYAQEHPDRVTELVLRGIYLGRESDNVWAFTETGAARLFPQEWEAFLAPIPLDERDDLLAAYGRLLFDPDPSVHLPAARAWAQWELSAGTLLPVPPPDLDDRLLLAFARIEQHYFGNDCFLGDGLLTGMARIRHIPGVIVHGRYDMKTTADGAYALHRAWPEAIFHIVEDAGHGGSEPGIRDRLLAATDDCRPVRIAGDGLVLREWTEDDTASLAKLFDDPDVAYRTPLNSPFGPPDARAYLADARRARIGGRRLQLAITTDGGPAKGEIRLNHAIGSISYTVGSSFRGQGLATRALRLITAHAHDRLGLPRVMLEIEPDNSASAAVARAAGFQPTSQPPVAAETGRRTILLETWAHRASG
jgi:proline iminopeptidase